MLGGGRGARATMAAHRSLVFRADEQFEMAHAAAEDVALLVDDEEQDVPE